jgi:CheY-like chemotaxis protein
MTHALFIDNDEGSLVLFREICLQMGIGYTGIQNPSHIAKLIPTLSAIDIVVLDLEMPHMTGYQVLNTFRSLPHLQNLTIVACSVHTGETEVAQAAGFNSFIVKPIDIDQFPQQLLAIMNGQAIWETHSH